MPQKESSCCDLNSAARVSRFFWGTYDAPDVMEWKVPGECARVKTMINCKMVSRMPARGDRLRPIVRVSPVM